MKRIIRNTTLLMAVIVMAACGGKGSDRQATTTKKEAEKVKVLTLQSERIAKQLELSSTLEGYETMNISPSITGHIEHIFVEVGSRVQKGTMLVRMDQTQLNTTRINLANTKTELDRVTALKSSGSVSEQVYDQTKAGYDQLVETEPCPVRRRYQRQELRGRRDVHRSTHPHPHPDQPPESHHQHTRDLLSLGETRHEGERL